MRNFTYIFILVASIFSAVPCATASVYVDVGDNAYELLLRLEAEGIIKSSLLTTKPLSRKEIIRLILEAEKNAEGKGQYVKSLVNLLKESFNDQRSLKPFDQLYTSYIYQDAHKQLLNYNNDGDIYRKGSNLRTGFSSIGKFGFFSFYFNPEVRHTDLIIKKGYVVLSLLGLDLTLGKDSQWWGPGCHGSILLSNNPEPMTMLRLTNPQPTVLPWIFRHLGLFRFTAFATRLEKERDIPQPYLWGMRFSFKPVPQFELGLQRTALLGGKGRPEDLKTWWRSFTAEGENEPGIEAGDQRAGFDIKLTLPFKVQPLQLYAEACGEDEAGGLPYKWAYLTGIYLPRIINFDRVGFRAEYAVTHVSGHPNVWYNHHLYTSGYTYKGRIIGHHIGTDSKDVFMKLSYLIPEKAMISISCSRQGHNLSGAIKKKDEATLMANIRLKKDVEIKTSYTYGKVKDTGTEEINTIMGAISYNF